MVVLLGVLALLVWNGVLWPNRLAADSYAVRGVDVSAYQGEIDWPVLAAEDLDFAFIKATEGSAHEDERFAANWEGARATDLLVGAYHFLSFESPGADQAAHMIDVVPAESGTLPPVVDRRRVGHRGRDGAVRRGRHNLRARHACLGRAAEGRRRGGGGE